MTTVAVQSRRGTTTEHTTFTGLIGESTIDTTKHTVVVHDGSTPGGFPLQKELSSGQNIKTINGTTILGSGNITLLAAIPAATTSILGGVKVDGTTITINGAGTITAIGGGGGLSPTGIKTAAYTAAKNELVRCNTTAGAFSVSMPSTPTDGDIVGVVDIYNTFTANKLTVLPNGGTIEGDATSLILDISGASVSFVYNQATTNWRLLETPTAAVSPPAAVTSVAAPTITATGTDITTSVVTSTSTPVITINIPSASATARGVLTAADWSTFNSKQVALVSGTNVKTVNGSSILGSGDLTIAGVTSVAALTIGNTGTDITSSVATSTSTPVITINIPSASATARGLLTSTDWGTFNSKQAAITFGTNVLTFIGTPSSANLSAAITDETGSGSLVFATSPSLTTPTTIGLKGTKIAMPANDINLATGDYFTKTISSAVTLTVSNVPTAGTVASFILDLINGGAATITWWTTKWAGGIAPTLTAAGRDSLGFFTHDGGTTWTGLVLGKDIK